MINCDEFAIDGIRKLRRDYEAMIWGDLVTSSSEWLGWNIWFRHTTAEHYIYANLVKNCEDQKL